MHIPHVGFYEKVQNNLGTLIKAILLISTIPCNILYIDLVITTFQVSKLIVSVCYQALVFFGTVIGSMPANKRSCLGLPVDFYGHIFLPFTVL